MEWTKDGDQNCRFPLRVSASEWLRTGSMACATRRVNAVVVDSRFFGTEKGFVEEKPEATYLLICADAVLDNELSELLPINELNPNAFVVVVLFRGRPRFVRKRSRSDNHPEMCCLGLDTPNQLLNHIATHCGLRLPMLSLNSDPQLKSASEAKRGNEISTLVCIPRNDSHSLCAQSLQDGLYQAFKSEIFDSPRVQFGQHRASQSGLQICLKSRRFPGSGQSEILFDFTKKVSCVSARALSLHPRK